MRKAAQNNDAAGISKYVDYPAVRASLKESLTATMRKELAKEPDNPYTALGAAFAKAIIDKMVDALVTPEAIAAMMRGEKPSPDKSPDVKIDTKNEDTPNISMGYESFSRFVVRASNKKQPGEEIGLVFARKGMSWKLSAVRLVP